ncbi:hypothetical protein FRC18_000884 [Serendipita sp. 400]|nr:hypothetical protein FRC18_000884 [Serendipita sp. 400]
MGFRDPFRRFDEYKYRRENQHLSTPTIERMLRQKTVELASSSFGMGAGIGGAAFTGGLSLLGTAYSARKYSVVEQQVAVLKSILIERGDDIPRERKRDFAVGAAIGVVALGIADVIPLAVHDAATSVAANATATAVATHAAPHVASATIAQHGTIKAFEAGAKEVAMSQLNAGAHAVGMHTSHAVSAMNVDPTQYSAHASAFNYGAEAAIKAEGKAATEAAKAVASAGISRGAERMWK